MSNLIHLTLSMILLIIVTANPDLTFGRPSIPVYFGLDVQKAQMQVEGGFSGVSRSFSGINSYGGIKINDYVAVEGGFSPNFVKSVDAERESISRLSKPYKPSYCKKETFSVVKNVRVKGFHIGLSSTYPILSSQHGKLEILGHVGAHFLKGSAEKSIMQDSRPVSINRFSGAKVIPRVLVGLQYTIDEQFGVRTYMGYSNTSRLVLYPKNGANLGVGGVKFKDTSFVGAGLFLPL